MASVVEFIYTVIYFVLDIANSTFGNQSQQVQPRTKKVNKKG